MSHLVHQNDESVGIFKPVLMSEVITVIKWSQDEVTEQAGWKL